MSLYTELVENNVPVSNHYSDLYFPKNDKTTAILAKYSTQKSNATRFINQVEGGVWYDVPFAFDPYWLNK